MIAGTYIVTGADMSQPAVHLLTSCECAWLADGVRIAQKHGSAETLLKVYARAFEPGATLAFIASPRMLAHIVGDDFPATVPHRDAVRAVAALLLLGEPLPTDGPYPRDGGGGDGGTRARLEPAPKQRPPGGAAVQPARAELAF